jgi:hypothetical protein
MKLSVSDLDEATWCVISVIADNFDKLPEKVRNVLEKLQRYVQRIIIDFSSSKKYGPNESYNKITAIELIAKTRLKLDEDFAFAVLCKLIEDKDEKVRKKAQKLASLMKKEKRRTSTTSIEET